MEFTFEIPALNDKVAVYTTRPDTAYGVTFMALAAEHPLIKKICENNPKADEINAFCERVRNQSEIERTSSESEKEGVFTGVYCINPFTGRKVYRVMPAAPTMLRPGSIWISGISMFSRLQAAWMAAAT